MTKKEDGKLSQELPRFKELRYMTPEEMAPHFDKIREEFKDNPYVLKGINDLASRYMTEEKNDQ